MTTDERAEPAGTGAPSEWADWAPERVWLQAYAGDEGGHTWADDPVLGEDELEAAYVRADVADTLIRQAREEAWRAGAKAARGMCHDMLVRRAVTRESGDAADMIDRPDAQPQLDEEARFLRAQATAILALPLPEPPAEEPEAQEGERS